MKISHSFKDGFKKDTLGAFADRFFGGYHFYAVLFQKAFIMSGVVTVTGKSVEFPNDNTIESVFITVVDHLLKFGTVVCFCSQRSIDIVADDVDFGALGKFHTLVKLPFDTRFRLIIRTISRVYNCFHSDCLLLFF